MTTKKKTAHELELERMAECTKAGVPFKRKQGRPAGSPQKKVKLTPHEYDRKRRRPRKRCTTRLDKNSPAAIKARERCKDPAWRARMEEKVWGPRRRGEMLGPRTGVPDGYTRETAKEMWDEAEKKAEYALAKLKENGHFKPAELPETDAERAELAMKEMLKIGQADVNTAHRIAAMSQVLKYCRVAPERRSKVTIESAEDWLAAAIADDEEDGPEEAAEAAKTLPN